MTEFPRLNFSNARTLASAFNNCPSMKGGTNFGLTLSNGITFNTMFNGCLNLQYLPQINLQNGKSLIGMFQNCYSLKQINIAGFCGSTGGWPTNAVSSFFAECNSLRGISISGDINFTGLTGSAYVNVYNAMFQNCYTLEKIEGLTGIQHSISFVGCHLGATALNNIYSSLAVVGASGAGSKTITVTNNWGTVNDTPSIATSKGWTVTG